MFQNVIQACIDLALHVARADFEYERDGSKAAFRVLAAKSVLGDQTGETLTDAVDFRNVLAHQYGSVRPEQVYTYLQTELEVYEAFSRQTARWFETKSGSA